MAVVLLIVAGVGGSAYALSLEEKDDFCASCHTQPELEYYQRSLATSLLDLASLHANKRKPVRCIDCHSGPPPYGRLEGLSLGVRDYLSYLAGRYPQPAITKHPLADSNCTKCHADIFASKSLNNHWHFYLPDWQQKEPQQISKCVDCHTSHTQEDGRVVPGASDTKVNEICAACHTFSGIRQ